MSLWPGLAIILTTLSLDLVSIRMRTALAPAQRWRLEGVREKMTDHLLQVKNLPVDFNTTFGTVHAVRDVSWHLERGETLANVGESGSGKSGSASAILS